MGWFFVLKLTVLFLGVLDEEKMLFFFLNSLFISKFVPIVDSRVSVANQNRQNYIDISKSYFDLHESFFLQQFHTQPILMEPKMCQNFLYQFHDLKLERMEVVDP